MVRSSSTETTPPRARCCGVTARPRKSACTLLFVDGGYTAM